MKTLRKGDNCQAVETLQSALNRAGASLTVDGIFGDNTYNTVIAFQTEHGLDVDGVAGPKTWAKLNEIAFARLGEAVVECIKDIESLDSFKRVMELI